MLTFGPSRILFILFCHWAISQFFGTSSEMVVTATATGSGTKNIYPRRPAAKGLTYRSTIKLSKSDELSSFVEIGNRATSNLQPSQPNGRYTDMDHQARQQPLQPYGRYTDMDHQARQQPLQPYGRYTDMDHQARQQPLQQVPQYQHKMRAHSANLAPMHPASMDQQNEMFVIILITVLFLGAISCCIGILCVRGFCPNCCWGVFAEQKSTDGNAVSVGGRYRTQ